MADLGIDDVHRNHRVDREHAYRLDLPVWSDPSRGNSELVRLLYAWWEAARGDADVPDRCDLRPDEMKRLLPFMFIADAEHDPFRVRYRLVGTRAVEVTGFDIIGVTRADFM